MEVALEAGAINRPQALPDVDTTLTEVLRPITADTPRRAHEIIESGRSRGKIVLEGF